ncbi:hypothetical protein KP509_01G053100 [Ceratopteris richardii]|nr:hypothetical protein KP509_01G053100 [Ceratopteris richardii]
MLLGIFGEDQELCVAIEEWKLDLTTDLSLGIFAKTTKQVWVQLGKPEDLYEQTIRHVLIYVQLFSIIVADSELTVSMLFELLTSKFYSWKVKPNICDLQESLAFMKKFNLTCLFPLDKQVLSRVMMEARDFGESDADNGEKPLTFKRARNKWHTNVETPISKASFDDSVKPTLLERNHPVSSGSDEESLVLNRRVKARMDTASASDLDQHEHSSPYKKDESSRCIVSTSEADFTSIEKLAATSPSEDFGDAEVPHDTCRGEEKLKVTDAQRRIHTIMTGVYNGGYGCSWGSKHEYDIEPLSTIERLWESTSKAFHALEILERGGTLEAAKHVCPVESLANISVDKDSLQAYGVHQFLPAVNRQKEVADRINYYAHDGDTVVEICSREVDYLSLLKERLTNLGKLCNYKRYVCNKSQRMDVKEWLNEQELPTGSKLLICLSLSFDLWGNQINKILDTALELKPKLIVLIAPLGSKRFDEQSAYSLIWADVELLQSEISWPWGLLEVSSDALVEGKGDSPTMFLWSRTDWATKHKQIASRFGHLKKSVSSGFKGRIVNS